MPNNAHSSTVTLFGKIKKIAYYIIAIISVIHSLSYTYDNREAISSVYSNIKEYVPFVDHTVYGRLMRLVLLPKIFNIPYSEKEKEVEEERNDEKPEKEKFIEKSVSNADKLFTIEQLSQYNGKNNDQIYLSILGNVYDVTSGAAFYGTGKSYNCFVGRDASRAFITGDFEENGLTDDVTDLSTNDLSQLRGWKQMYDNKYKYKGKLIGRFYDEAGLPTSYLLEVEKKFKEADHIKLMETLEKEQYPPCNVEWKPDTGSRVWCTAKSGGIERSWIGVPRKFYQPDLKSYRCACVKIDIDFLKKAAVYLRQYDNCEDTSTSCYVIPESVSI